MEVNDRRRIRFSEKCFCDSDESSFPAQFHDLSLDGAYIAATKPFPSGHKFRLRFALLGKWIATPCVVRYVNPGTGMGVKFLALPREQRNFLVRHLGRLLERLGESAHAKKRAASRLAACIPITVSGTDVSGKPFDEETETLNVSERGACVRLRHPVSAGSVVQVKATLGTHARPADFRVVWAGGADNGNKGQVGLTPTVLDLWRSWYLPSLQELDSERFQTELQPEPKNRF